MPLHLGVVAIEKGAFRSPSTKVANITLLTVNNYTGLGRLLYRIADFFLSDQIF